MGVEIHPELLLLVRRQLLDGIEHLLRGECNVRHALCSLVCVRIMRQGALLGCLQPCAWLGARPHAFGMIVMGQRGGRCPARDRCSLSPEYDRSGCGFLYYMLIVLSLHGS
jgi:hypothetical protein